MAFVAGTFHTDTFRSTKWPGKHLRALGNLHGHWRRRLRLRHDLERLLRTGPHVLEDIGLTVAAVQQELEKPFWRP